MTQQRIMNHAQHSLLDGIAKRDPQAKVIGWADGDVGNGPLIRFSDGQVRVAAYTGRTRQL